MRKIIELLLVQYSIDFTYELHADWESGFGNRSTELQRRKPECCVETALRLVGSRP